MATKTALRPVGLSTQAVTAINNKAKARRARLWKLFRTTPEEQSTIEAFQRNHKAFALLMGDHMGLDHDHATGRIRGRLDFRINRAYGIIERFAPRNTSDVLRALAEYHDNPPAVTALGGPRFGLLGQAKAKRKMVYGGPQLRDTTNKRRKKS